LQWDRLGVCITVVTITTVAVNTAIATVIVITVTLIKTTNVVDREELQMKEIKRMGLLVCLFLTAVVMVPPSRLQTRRPWW